MANDIAGTIQKCSINGLAFDVMADSNISLMGSLYENDGIPTSGRTIRKMTKRVQTAEGLVIAANSSERKILQDIADDSENVPLTYTLASGDVYTATGFIEFENIESEEARAAIKMFPSTGNGWEVFEA